MLAELKQGNNGIVFSDFCHYPQDKAAGSPYNTTFSVQVSSDAFAGGGKWTCDCTAILAFGEALTDMYAFKRTSAVLKDITYGSRVEMTMDKTGHLRVSGVVYGKAAEQSLTFSLEADQTALQTFAAAWRRVEQSLL